MSLLGFFRSSRATAEGVNPAGADPGAARVDADNAEPPGVNAAERGVASIGRTRSLQARVSNVLAAGLMSVLALGFLAWYYTQTFARQSREQSASQSKTKQQAQGEMALPPLGRVDPPMMQQILGPPPEQPVASDFSVETLSSTEPVQYPPAMNYGYGHEAVRTPRQNALERQLAGPVFVNASSHADPKTGRGDNEASYAVDAERPGIAIASSAGSGTSALAGMLEPTSTPTAMAKVLPTQRLLLPKGAFVDCTLETAIDSSLPGMTTCVTATDTFGADGTVVLLERGTKLVGETRGDVRQGGARVYVLWTEARTPEGVVVPLASPGTDELGRAGLPGEVDRHFMDRFGAAILVSLIDGGIQAATQRSGNGAVIVNPSASRDVMTEVLRSTINIPPTVTKQQGDRIAVLVARDLDFRSVYELRPAALSR